MIAIPENGPVLTVNSRLARWLLLDYDQKQKESGRKAWPSPEIYPLNSWLKQIWVQSWPPNHFLSELQAGKLWENIIREDPEPAAQDLLHFEGPAEQAFNACHLIREYRLPVQPALFNLTDESRVFLRWKEQYEQALREMNALDPSALMDTVREGMAAGKLPIPREVMLAGFEEISPQLQDWLDLLEERNTRISYYPARPDPRPPVLAEAAKDRNVEVREFPDRKSETIQCARWVRTHYRPGQTFGIVVPELEHYRSLLKRELAAELAPGSVFPWETRELPFNISLGTPLAGEPMVHIALDLLSAPGEGVELARFSTFIKSPFHKGESGRANALDLELRKENMVTVYLEKILERVSREQSPELRSVIELWKRLAGTRGKKLPSDWAQLFSHLMRDIGWPAGNRGMTSRMVQAYESWKQCLGELASLDHILGPMTRIRAATLLNQMAQEKLFQIKTREQTIQVVGHLESSGMRFDHLWVMGCHSEALPCPPSPNPFLPRELQKENRLPHSTADRELEFAERTLARLMESSQNIVFSTPVWAENMEMELSPLLTAFLGTEPPREIQSSHRVRDQFEPDSGLEVIRESAVLPVPPDEQAALEAQGQIGGTRLLKNQSECPFRAFAAHRLCTEKVQLPEVDFSNLERGNLVHKALEFFWQEIRSLRELQSLESEQRLEEKIHDAVTRAVNSVAFSGRLSNQGRFSDIERNRASELLREWMDHELLRSDFQVFDEEAEESIQLGGLTLKMRVDRIDQTPNGTLLVIDYKTGEDVSKNAPKNWFGDRPREPQLPLYALKWKPAGIAFAQVKKGDCKFRVAYDPNQPVLKIKNADFTKETGCLNWQGLISYWEEKLTALVNRFLEGQTAVDPLKPEQVCRNCGLQPLCRIDELNLSRPERLEEDEEEES